MGQAVAVEFRVAGQELPRSYEKAFDAVLQNSLLLAAGSSKSGLLVFRLPHPKTKWLRVELVLTLPSGDIVRFVAPYQRRKLDKHAKE